MFLYDMKNNGNLDVYSVKSNHERLKHFRAKEINKVKVSDRFYKIATNNPKYENGVFVSTIQLRDLQYENGNIMDGITSWSDFTKYENPSKEQLEKQKEVLQSYINGNFFETPFELMSIVQQYSSKEGKTKDLQYLLFTENPTVFQYPATRIEFENILSLPKKLYLLRLMEMGYFSWIDGNENLSSLIDLFDISFENSITSDEFTKIINAGLFKEGYNEIKSKVMQRQLILRQSEFYKQK